MRVNVPRSAADEDPARITWREGEEAVQQRQAHAVEDFDQRRPSGTGAGEDVGPAVAVDVTDGHAHDALEEGRAEGEEVGDQAAGLAVEDLNLWTRTRVGAHDDVGEAVAVDVAGRHEDAAGEAEPGDTAG